MVEYILTAGKGGALSFTERGESCGGDLQVAMLRVVISVQLFLRMLLSLKLLLAVLLSLKLLLVVLPVTVLVVLLHLLAFGEHVSMRYVMVLQT
jgi:hypothetical protein